MDFISTVNSLKKYGNTVIAVSDYRKNTDGIASFMNEHGVSIVKTLKGEGKSIKAVYIIELTDDNLLDDEEFTNVHLDYLEHRMKRNISPKQKYQTSDLSHLPSWDINFIAEKEFGVKKPEIYSQKALKKAIIRDSRKYFADLEMQKQLEEEMRRHETYARLFDLGEMQSDKTPKALLNEQGGGI